MEILIADEGDVAARPAKWSHPWQKPSEWLISATAFVRLVWRDRSSRDCRRGETAARRRMAQRSIPRCRTGPRFFAVRGGSAPRPRAFALAGASAFESTRMRARPCLNVVLPQIEAILVLGLALQIGHARAVGRYLQSDDGGPGQRRRVEQPIDRQFRRVGRRCRGAGDQGGRQIAPELRESAMDTSFRCVAESITSGSAGSRPRAIP